jgi:hypothetical protein
MFNAETGVLNLKDGVPLNLKNKYLHLNSEERVFD